MNHKTTDDWLFEEHEASERVHLPVVSPVGNRMSSLPVSRFCGLAGKLGSQYGSGRAAAMGTAFHALCAENGSGDPLEGLTDKERETVLSWQQPTTLQVPDGPLLHYESADKETAVALDADGRYVPPDSPIAACVGHVDFFWHVNSAGGEPSDSNKLARRSVVYVADIKKSSFTASGPGSLQLVAGAGT